MESIFGLIKSQEFSEALEKTFAKFEAMPAQEFFRQAREHADGDIAKFNSAWADSAAKDYDDIYSAKEISLVFESEDSSLKSFKATFTHEAKMIFDSHNKGCQEHKCYCAVSSAVAPPDIPYHPYPAAA